MAIKFDDYMAGLPKKRRQVIKKRAAELIAEEATLRQVREARERSQEQVAKQLHIKQAAVSKLEVAHRHVPEHSAGLYRGDGGQARNRRPFSEPAVRITQFEMLDPEQRPS